MGFGGVDAEASTLFSLPGSLQACIKPPGVAVEFVVSCVRTSDVGLILVCEIDIRDSASAASPFHAEKKRRQRCNGHAPGVAP